MSKFLKYFIILILISDCSFNKKSKFWTGYEKELERVAKLEEDRLGKKFKIFSNKNNFSQEISANKSTILSLPKKNNSWQMPGQNLQNYLGNFYFKYEKNRFLKKKIGKNKFDIPFIIQAPIIFENNLILSDDNGSIFKINKNGQVYWKKNIYKKIYKKLYKKITFSLYKNTLYLADNIGFVYALNYENGNVLWKINFGIPFKSKIKVYNDRIFIVDQDNQVLCLNIKDGSKIWNLSTIGTFIKTQNLLGMAISKNGHLIFLSSAGDILKINSSNGRIFWTMNILDSTSSFAADFFESSDVVIDNNNIIFSSNESTFSVNINTGFINWRTKVASNGTPIIDKNNIFLVNEVGYFINLDKKTGKIIWSTNILKSLKKKKQRTKVNGFIMGSNKIFVTTENGYLIICSAVNSKILYHDKIAKSVRTTPIISNGELYILTENSKILGFN